MVGAGDTRRLYDYATQKEFQDSLVSPEPTALPFVSPAYHALFFLPLSLLSYRTAYFVFLVINIAALGVCIALLQPWMKNLRAIYGWLPYAMFLAFMPIVMTLIQGQDSILLTTLLAGAFVLLVRQRDLAAGLCAGLGLFKFPVVLPIALLFLIWRRWPFLMGFAASATVLASLSVWMAGITQTSLYILSLISIAGLRAPVSDLSRYPINWQQMANVHGLLYGLCAGWMSKPSLNAITVLFSGAVMAWTAFKGFKIKNPPLLLLLAIPCSVLVGHHTYVHDLSALLVSVVVLLNSFLPSEAGPDRGGRLIGRAAAVMFVVPVTDAFFPNHFYVVALAVFGLLVSVASAQSNEHSTELAHMS